MIVTVTIYSIEEESIKNTVVRNQVEIQEIITKSISKNINSELNLIIFEMSLLAESEQLQEDIGTKESNNLISQTFNRINSISPAAQILALDGNFKVLSQVSKNHDSFVGATVRGLPELMDSEQGRAVTDPRVFTINTSLFDEPEIAITYPIFDNDTHVSSGLLLVTFPSSEFFKRHGNIYDVESQFLMVMDENNVLLIHPNMENVGKGFFDDEIQQDIGENQILNKHIQHVSNGNLATAIFSLDDNIGERINSAVPVSIDGKNEFVFGVVTPTHSINQEIDEIIFFTKIQTIFLLMSTIAVLLVFLLKRTQSFKKEKLTVIGQLSSNIAHDIRNPLGTIKNAGVIIEKENNHDNEIISRELSRINLSVRRISHQIEEVLNYVRTTPMILKPCSIYEIVKEAADTIDVPSNIKINFPENDVTVSIDPEKILIVFVNIMLNAVQSIGKDDGHVTVSIRESSSNVIIKIENSGPSIPSNDLKRIFDALFTTKLEGTGLGLSSCKNIVEQHKGTIHVATDPVTFSIRIPK